MPIGLDFGNVKKSPYMDRKDRTFGRRGGRPTGTPGGGAPTGGIDPRTYKGTQLTSEQIEEMRGRGTNYDPSSIPTGTPTGSGIQTTQQQTPYAGFLQGLTKPIGTPYESQFKERAGLLREYTQGAYETAAEGLRTKMAGGQGLRAGESGIADTAIGRVQKAGAEELTRGYRGLAAEEGRLEQQYKMGAAGLDLQRQMGGGALALRGEEGALDRQMRYYESQQTAEQREWQPYWQTQYGG